MFAGAESMQEVSPAAPRHSHTVSWVSKAAEGQYIKDQAIWTLDIKSCVECSPKIMARGRGCVVKRRLFGAASGAGEAIRVVFNKGKLLSCL